MEAVMWIGQLGLSLLALLLGLLSWVVVVRGRGRRRRAVGFFHPFTNDDGGGERVLWCVIKAIQEEFLDLDTAVYTCDEASSESLAARVLNWFGIKLLSLPKHLAI